MTRRLGIGVHVGRGREIHVDAQRGQLLAQVVAGLVGVTGGSGSAQRKVAR